MRTDPNEACTNTREDFFWAFVHDAVSHPLMALSLYSDWSLRFHNYTSHRAWPRVPSTSHAEGLVSWEDSKQRAYRLTWTRQEDFWTFRHPYINHDVTVKAPDLPAAYRQMDEWFMSLEEVLGN